MIIRLAFFASDRQRDYYYPKKGRPDPLLRPTLLKPIAAEIPARLLLKRVNPYLPIQGVTDTKGVITYPYSRSHKTIRFVREGKKVIIPYHLSAGQSVRWVKGLGDVPWGLYHEDHIPTTVGNAVILAEGEKTCDYIQGRMGLVALTPQGSLWNTEYLTQSLRRLQLRDAALKSVVYLPDCDEPGIAKRNLVLVAAAHSQLGCVVIPSELYAPQPDLIPPGFDLADSELTGHGVFIERANQFLSSTQLYNTELE